ncbi:hypothetical protein SAMN05660766_0978 [Curtobacterium sp. 314Chir4.1]|uniref:hypothetical protein n=1 Tax=Curtobacterium sp. 314Chir4.1 TaxID=1279028 RepID=UPI000BCDBE9E|nr:hypothetical protein [Curtobacterium sp. 314Chir4.1]SOC87309.1 hypothetical protein SAMN05660766_0978 [Curtobacterium sp. 314Chir4.1]
MTSQRSPLFTSRGRQLRSEFQAGWVASSLIREDVYIPKFYHAVTQGELDEGFAQFELLKIATLVDLGEIEVSTGHEIGKASYGTGDIPFVRTSDIANFELKTIPKQGVSQRIYDDFAAKQDVRSGDILFVRDGTYLIGRSCFVTDADSKMLYQSHVMKIRVSPSSRLSSELLFLLLNSPMVQRQIRAFQFTADIIDTIGRRFFDIQLPVPREGAWRTKLTRSTAELLNTRSSHRVLIQHFPDLIERALSAGSAKVLHDYIALSPSEQVEALSGRTITSEFGDTTATWRSSTSVEDGVLLPKFYDEDLNQELESLADTCDLRTLGDLIESDELTVRSGCEPGKLAYGSGEVPFIRTSDFSNWELAGEAKQGVSEAVYDSFADRQYVAGDVLLVRDGTYLVGSSCIVTDFDKPGLYSGGVVRLRATEAFGSPFLLLALLNSHVVKRQMRARQFTRDVIDTLGQRYLSVKLPVPKDEDLRAELGALAMETVLRRVKARDMIRQLSNELWI